MILRNIIPLKVRLYVKLLKRYVSDYMSFVSFAETICPQDYSFFIEEQQIIKPTAFYENKVHNLRLGSSYIQDVEIAKGEVLSFWNLIGQPSRKKGFKDGRNLIDGKVCSDVGGGLCQLSGIIYLTALKAGLNIIERYNHTVDIYKTDEDRFTPLGSDATIVYGYKDLRIQNPYDFSVKFRFDITNNSIQCRLLSVKKINNKEVDFIINNKNNDSTIVNTLLNGEFFTTSFYKNRL